MKKVIAAITAATAMALMQTPSVYAAPPELEKAVVTDTAPTSGTMTVVDAHKKAKDGETVIVEGRVRDFVNGVATFTLLDRSIKSCVEAARRRGVLFDVGHGMGSFAFKSARVMLANGFQPDTISSDIHKLCINGPAFDQVTTLSKFLCLGMSLNDVIAASTCNAAFALKRLELGSLKPGSVGDATLLSLDEGEFDYVDTVGEHLPGDRKLTSRGVVLGGKWWHPA